MEQYKQEFIEFMVASDVLKFGDFTLKSGRKSPFFMNAGERSMNYFIIIDAVTLIFKHFIHFVDWLWPDCYRRSCWGIKSLCNKSWRRTFCYGIN